MRLIVARIIITCLVVVIELCSVLQLRLVLHEFVLGFQGHGK